jgi:hypothetical protein
MDRIVTLASFPTSLSRLLAIALMLLARSAPAENVQTTVIVGMDEAGHAIHPPADQPADSWSATRIWNGKAARFNQATRRLVFESFDADRAAGSKPRSALDHGDTSRKSVNPFAALVFNAATASSDPGVREKSKALYITKPDGSDGVCVGCKTSGRSGDRECALGKWHGAFSARDGHENLRCPE